MLIILLILNLINNIIIISLNKEYFTFYFINGLSLILCNILEKYSTHFFEYIIPQNYIICKIQGNTFINIISTLSRLIAAVLLMGSFINYTLIIYIMNFALSLICTILFLGLLL